MCQTLTCPWMLAACSAVRPPYSVICRRARSCALIAAAERQRQRGAESLLRRDQRGGWHRDSDSSRALARAVGYLLSLRFPRSPAHGNLTATLSRRPASGSRNSAALQESVEDHNVVLYQDNRDRRQDFHYLWSPRMVLARAFLPRWAQREFGSLLQRERSLAKPFLLGTERQVQIAYLTNVVHGMRTRKRSTLLQCADCRRELRWKCRMFLDAALLTSQAPMCTERYVHGACRRRCEASHHTDLASLNETKRQVK